MNASGGLWSHVILPHLVNLPPTFSRLSKCNQLPKIQPSISEVLA